MRVVSRAVGPLELGKVRAEGALSRRTSPSTSATAVASSAAHLDLRLPTAGVDRRRSFARRGVDFSAGLPSTAIPITRSNRGLIDAKALRRVPPVGNLPRRLCSAYRRWASPRAIAPDAHLPMPAAAVLIRRWCASYRSGIRSVGGAHRIGSAADVSLRFAGPVSRRPAGLGPPVDVEPRQLHGRAEARVRRAARVVVFRRTPR